MGIIEDAKKLACERHEGLRRPSVSRQLLIEHLAEVADMASNNGMSDETVAAAWLHDIVEDTQTTLPEITQKFGGIVAELVEGLTDPVHFAPLPIEQRKQLQADRLKDKSDLVKKIKLCDQISNVKSVLFDPPTDWPESKSYLYIEGAKKLADVCRGLVPELDIEFDRLYNISLDRQKNRL